MEQSIIQDDIFLKTQDQLYKFKTDCLSILDTLEAHISNEPIPIEENTTEKDEDTEMKDGDDNTQNTKPVIPYGSETQKQLAKLGKQVDTDLVILRDLNRQSQESINEIKNQTISEKDRVDQIQLDIQNIFYQHKHLKNEIDRCRDFPTKHQQLDMVPIERFYADHPEFSSPSNATNNDNEETKALSDHELMLARLKDEQDRRLHLFVIKGKLLERKNELKTEADNFKTDLIKLDLSLNSFINQAQPISKMLQKH